MYKCKLNAYGQKGYQMDNDEDRGHAFKKWVHQNRKSTVDGFFLDTDLIKWQGTTNREVKPKSIIEITRFDDKPVVGQKYLDAIINRYNTQAQGKVTRTLSKILDVPAYIILYQKDILWMYVYSFRADRWKFMKPEECLTFLEQL